jgi:AcrR family transcriptional regulator
MRVGVADRRQPVDPRALLRDRILDATIRCIAEAGLTGTTIDDIARAASCGRATVYRAFAGGRDAILVAAGIREVERFLAELAVRLEACATLEDTLVEGITGTVRHLRGHPVVRYLVVHEPAVLLPFVGFDGLDPLLARASDVGERHLTRFTDPATARSVGEWAARVVVAYGCGIDPTGTPVDLADEGAVRGLVRTFGLPGLALTTQE